MGVSHTFHLLSGWRTTQLMMEKKEVEEEPLGF